MMDSDTLGWLLCTGIAVYFIFKNWRRFIKLVIFAIAAMFILFVVQIKKWYDTIILTEPTTPKTERVYDVKAEIDSTETIHIKEIKERK
jgi:LPS O-antigen subunit length determinant protein (WzzB/FepE family)